MKVLKNTFLVLLALSTSFSSNGFQVYKHFCGGYLASVSVLVSSNPCADENGEESCHKDQDRKCCEDQDEFMQLDVDLCMPASHALSFKAPAQLPVYIQDLSDLDWPMTSLFEIPDRAPPFTKVIPLFILHKQFITYG